ncbi:type II secretion system minor pseudopilin GspK [Piscinibacter sakaiensis]|uniref:type II secretion system minor pseudopilin GspK n=1 Tax=Piscinibacter sakaiensis TaxID=1547922 RepID=UPI003AADD60D
MTAADRRLGRPPRTAQRGAALLLAMLIVTLVATLAAAMVWQQWRATRVEAAERARSQSAWILAGALDWARLILREDNPNVDHLGEPWAVPLAEARLSSFLAAEGDSNLDDGPQAFLSGSVTDAQARYNLNNLVVGSEVVAAELATLERLFGSLGVPVASAATIANGLADADPDGRSGAAPVPVAASGASAAGFVQRQQNPNPPLRPQSLEQLAWFGIDREALQLMRPHVALLPALTPINLNTATAEVMVAVIDKLDAAGAQRLVQTRERRPFDNIASVQALLGESITLDERRVAVASGFFEVRGRLRLGERALEERSLVQRVQRQVTVLTRERVGAVP